jgi:hypothetical protein
VKLVFQSCVGVRTELPFGLSVPTLLCVGSEQNIDQSALTKGDKATLVTIIKQNTATAVFPKLTSPLIRSLKR